MARKRIPEGQLSPTEARIARATLSGATGEDIAKHFGMSRRTVEVHRLHINAKIKAKSPTHAGYLLAKAGYEPLDLNAPAESAPLEE